MYSKEVIRIERNSHIDTLRVIASLGVVFIHAASYAKPLPFALINALTRFSVPVFFMISGYFMLERDYSLSDILKKTARLLALMLGWSALYCIISRPENFVKALFLGPVHFWYFYAAVSLYLLTPILSVFTKNCDKKAFRYALILLFVTGCIIHVSLGVNATFADIVSKTKFPTSTGFIFCYIFGAYVKRFSLTRNELLTIRICGILGVILTFCAILFVPSMTDIAISFFSPAVTASALAAFTLPVPRKIASLAPYTLGIYIIHILVLNYVSQPIFSFMQKGFVYVLANGFLTFVLSLIISIIIKKIPILKKTI